MNNPNNKSQLLLIITLIAIAAGLRLLPHAPNFAPIGALALFGGAYLKKHWSYVLPIGAMIASDLLIGLYNFKIMAAVYLSFILIVFLGTLARQQKSAAKIIGLTLTGSIVFFFITNFAVWALTPMYPQTISGLASCFIAALPFFKNTLLGDLFYVGIFFGSFEIISFLVRKQIITTPLVIPADKR